jgi:hypothetical protein
MRCCVTALVLKKHWLKRKISRMLNKMRRLNFWSSISSWLKPSCFRWWRTHQPRAICSKFVIRVRVGVNPILNVADPVLIFDWGPIAGLSVNGTSTTSLAQCCKFVKNLSSRSKNFSW